MGRTRAVIVPGLDAEELLAYREQGFVVREAVLSPTELVEIARACEDVVRDLEAESQGQTHHLSMGSYVFEIVPSRRTVIKWEKESPETLLGVEPVAHLDARLEAWAHDPRLAAPMANVIGCDEVRLYTEKLNVKRARTGGPIVLHQDHPYWVGVSDDPERVATAILFLDDATRENGCLEVAPGSHRSGAQEGKDDHGFGRNEIDPARYDGPPLVPLEVPAGSLVFLGPYLVHGSAPNRTDADRRALLYSYQPAGFRHSSEYIRIDPSGRMEIGLA